MTIQTPQAPEGYFFRVRQAHGEHLRSEVVFVELRERKRFGRSTVFEFHSARINGGEHAIHDTMLQLIGDYETHINQTEAANSHAARFLGDYPPKTL